MSSSSRRHARRWRRMAYCSRAESARKYNYYQDTPYSPELNPAEKPWQYLKDNYLSQRIFSSYNDIVDACQIAWNKMTAEKGRITSLTNFPYLQYNDI